MTIILLLDTALLDPINIHMHLTSESAESYMSAGTELGGPGNMVAESICARLVATLASPFTGCGLAFIFCSSRGERCRSARVNAGIARLRLRLCKWVSPSLDLSSQLSQTKSLVH